MTGMETVLLDILCFLRFIYINGSLTDSRLIVHNCVLKGMYISYKFACRSVQLGVCVCVHSMAANFVSAVDNNSRALV